MKKFSLTMLILVGFVVISWGIASLIINKTKVEEDYIKIVRLDFPLTRIEYVQDLHWGREYVDKGFIIPGIFVPSIVIRIVYNMEWKCIERYQRGRDYKFNNYYGDFIFIEWWGRPSSVYNEYRLTLQQVYETELFRIKLKEAEEEFKKAREQFEPIIEENLGELKKDTKR